MVQRASAISPAVLVWARERAGLSIAEVAARIGKAPEVVAAWERGESFPAYGQLETLAEDVFKRPVALFFFPEPPAEQTVRHEFRTLPEADAESLSSDTRYALRDAHAFQLSLREISGGQNPAFRLISRDIRPSPDQDLVQLASALRDYLGISLAVQQSWRNAEVALTEWRDAVEACGVFVFKRSFKDSDISGFCLHDDVFPIVVINNSTPFTRQVFTLFHELAHILFGVSSITRSDPRSTASFVPAYAPIEVACNRLAAEFLVPSASLPWQDFRADEQDDFVSDMAARYNVSREVVLRRLLDRGLVTRDTYVAHALEWNTEAPRDGGGESGGNYYSTQAVYLSRAMLGMTFSQYRAGRLSLPEVAEHLRMKAKNVAKFENYLFARS